MTITVSGSNHIHVAAAAGWTIPTGICNFGDLVIGAFGDSMGVQVGKSYTKVSPGVPAGWLTLLRAPSGGPGQGAVIMYRTASAADASGTASYGSMLATGDVIGSFVGLGGVNVASPFDTSGPNTSGSNPTLPNTHGTAGAANEMAVVVALGWSSSGNFNWAPANGGSIDNGFHIETNSIIDNFTLTQANGFLPQPRRSQLLATQLVPIGATGTTTLTPGSGHTGSFWQTWTLFVKPAVAAPSIVPNPVHQYGGYF